jgi:hypothetical protein
MARFGVSHRKPGLKDTDTDTNTNTKLKRNYIWGYANQKKLSITGLDGWIFLKK